MLVYDETPLPMKGSPNLADMDATKLWLRHYENSLTLQFFLKNGSTAEKAQASREMVICERKMKFWANHPNYIKEIALESAKTLKAVWKDKI